MSIRWITGFGWRMAAGVVCLLTWSNAALAGDVSLSAAASLKDVVNELCDNYSRTHRGTRFLKNFGGSGQLAKQVQSGAPADIFLPANLEWVDYLKTRNLLDTASIGTFAYNTLVFAGAPGTVASMGDLVRLQRVAVGSPASVPAGEYAVEALKKAGVLKQLEKKLVMAKDVRDCLRYAEQGEVDGGFVYRTDALQARKAKILFAVPQELYPRVVYPLALTLSGAKNSDAVAFFSYLRSNEARPVLVKYGFGVR